MDETIYTERSESRQRMMCCAGFSGAAILRIRVIESGVRDTVTKNDRAPAIQCPRRRDIANLLRIVGDGSRLARAGRGHEIAEAVNKLHG